MKSKMVGLWKGLKQTVGFKPFFYLCVVFFLSNMALQVSRCSTHLHAIEFVLLPHQPPPIPRFSGKMLRSTVLCFYSLSGLSSPQSQGQKASLSHELYIKTSVGTDKQTMCRQTSILVGADYTVDMLGQFINRLQRVSVNASYAQLHYSPYLGQFNKLWIFHYQLLMSSPFCKGSVYLGYSYMYFAGMCLLAWVTCFRELCASIQVLLYAGVTCIPVLMHNNMHVKLLLLLMQLSALKLVRKQFRFGAGAIWSWTKF